MSSSPTRGGVTVRKVEVDQDRLRAREEKQERLRQEREAAARARNEYYTTDFDEPGNERVQESDEPGR